jgi:tetratricopeptide (TPR) repeat protein
MLKKGHLVITTNFDHLIEYALNQSGIPLGDIIPIITREDFEAYSDPYEQLKQGKKLVYKVHGSPTNLITQESTKDSLVATIQAFGSNKEAESVFQLESFKQPAFENLTKGRSLAVIGYSGSDDFDIVPTLKELKDLKNVVWINYSHDIDLGKEEIYEINEDTHKSLNKMSLNIKKVVHILLDIWGAQNTDNVYLINVNTSKLARELIESKPNVSSEDFSFPPKVYLNEIYSEVDEILKFYIPYKIYIDKDIYDSALTPIKNILNLAEEKGDIKWKSIAHNNLGELYNSLGRYSESLRELEDALTHSKKIKDLTSITIKSKIFNNMASVYANKNDYPEALRYYKDAARIQKQRGDLKGTLINFNNIGDIYRIQERFTEALKYYEEALEISQKLGSISLRGSLLNNSGLTYVGLRNYKEAIKRYNEALQIAEQLGNKSLKLACLYNIGKIKQAQGNYQETKDLYIKALNIANQIGSAESKELILKALNSINGQKSGIGVDLTSPKRIIKDDIECHPKWTNNDIKKFIKGFFEKVFNEIRDNLNWQRIETTVKEEEPNKFHISSGSPIQAIMQILGERKRIIHIEWEEHSDTVKLIWEGITKQFRIIFSNPGPKSLKKLKKK